MLQIEVKNVMQVFVAGLPHAQTRARTGTHNVYSNATKGVKRWKGVLDHELRAARRRVGFQPLVGALCVDMVFMVPTKDAKRWGEISHVKPDKDNLEKAVLDVMEGAEFFAVGDSQVGAGQVVKVWCKQADAGVLINVAYVRVKKAPAGESEGMEWLA